MEFFRRARRTELGGLASDSFYVGIWQGATGLADLAQIALVTHALGLYEYGKLALAMTFVVLVGQLFDVRVGAAATTFGAAKLAGRDLAGAGGVFQLSYLIDASTGILGFLIVIALAPLVGPHLIGSGGTMLILLYALTLLVSTVDESSISILRLLDRFRLIAGYTAGLELLRVGAIGVALLISKSLTAVLVALVAYDLVGAVVNFLVASRVFRRVAGFALASRALVSSLPDRRAIVRMVLHTNVVSYARLSQVQLPTLLVGVFSGVTQVAFYKIGTAAAAIIGRLADTAYAAVLPRFSRLWASGRITELRRLVKHSTLISAVSLATALLVLVLLRQPILSLLGGTADAGRAKTVLVLAGIGQLANGVVFWNTGLLFAAGRSRIVSSIAVAGALFQLLMLVPLVKLFGASGAAGAFLLSSVITNAIAAWFGIVLLRGPGAALGRFTRKLAAEPPVPRIDRTSL